MAQQEKTAQPQKNVDVGRLARVGMMCALSTVLGFFPEIPLAFFAPWLKLDFAYVPMLLTGFALGFPSGFAVLIVKNVFKLLATSSGGVGEIADILIGLSMLVPATLVYGRMKSRKGALIGMLSGTVLMVITGILANRFILLPFFMGDGFTAYMTKNPAILWTAVAPFNLIKGALISAITFLLYKHLSPFLKRGLKG